MLKLKTAIATSKQAAREVHLKASTSAESLSTQIAPSGSCFIHHHSKVGGSWNTTPTLERMWGTHCGWQGACQCLHVFIRWGLHYVCTHCLVKENKVSSANQCVVKNWIKLHILFLLIVDYIFPAKSFFLRTSFYFFFHLAQNLPLYLLNQINFLSFLCLFVTSLIINKAEAWYPD